MVHRTPIGYNKYRYAANRNNVVIQNIQNNTEHILRKFNIVIMHRMK